MTSTPDPRAPHPQVPGWVGDVVAASLIVLIAFAPFPNAEFRPGNLLVTAVAIAPAALLPFRRRWPVSVLAAIIALYGIAAFAGTLAPGIVLGAAIAMFGVATRSNRRRTFIVAGATVVAIILLSLLAAIGSVFDPRAIQFVFTIAFAAAAGDASRSRREYITAITDRAERAEKTRESEARRRVTEERLKIARDLHDTVAHQISVISLNAGVASSALSTRPDKALEALGLIRSAARSVLGEIGDLLMVLRGDDAESPASAPQPGLEQLDSLVSRLAGTGLAVTTRIEGELGVVSGSTDIVAYRVIQEALTNAHKHGSGHRAHVFISVLGDSVTIIVTNPVAPADGDPHPDETTTAAVGGHGLLGLRERVASVRGTVTTGLAGGTFRLAADLPLSREEPT